MKITTEEFNAFLNAKRKAGYQCSFCGDSSLVINSDFESVPLELGILHTPGSPQIRHDFFSISCSNCGRADLFHINQIQKYLNVKNEGTI